MDFHQQYVAPYRKLSIFTQQSENDSQILTEWYSSKVPKHSYPRPSIVEITETILDA